MEEHGAAGLPAAHQAGRFADCRRLSGRHQHPSGASGARRGGRRRGRQKPALAKAGDTVSRVWRRVKADWDAWNARSLAAEPIVRLILDGTVVRVRLDSKAPSIVLVFVLGVRQDGQKVLLAVKNMGGETSQAWRAVLDDLVKRGLRQPEFLIVDGGTGVEQGLAGLSGGAMAAPTPVPSTSIATDWPARPRGCTTRSRPTTTT